jgi:hypothetical protein
LKTAETQKAAIKASANPACAEAIYRGIGQPSRAPRRDILFLPSSRPLFSSGIILPFAARMPRLPVVLAGSRTYALPIA